MDCSNKHNSFANKYEFDPDGLNALRLNSAKYNLPNWLAILTKTVLIGKTALFRKLQKVSYREIYA